MADQNQNNPSWPPSNTPEWFGKHDRVGPMGNPGGTNPYPLPTNLPVPSHDFPRNPLIWGPGAAGGNPVNGVVEATSFTATWQTPILDLRPELRASNVAAPMNVVPIWRQVYGAGGQLFVQVENLLSAADSLTGLVVHTIELGHVNDPGLVVSIAQPEDISSYFTNHQASALVPIVPPGSGYPVRYWQVQIIFDFLTVTGTPAVGPPFLVSAAYY